ncbi:hypothetical protein AB0N07_44925 [Streptomyces sp. NPDC051172]
MPAPPDLARPGHRLPARRRQPDLGRAIYGRTLLGIAAQSTFIT